MANSQGTLIGVVCYEQHISAVSRLLQPYQRYYVSNAYVKDARAEYKNVSLTKEIDLAIRNKEVLCFMKCIDRTFQGNNVRTYPILKMYLKSELTCGERENTASICASEAGTSSAVAALEGDGTKEFFTLTIKSMLDEIHVAPDEATHSVQSTAVKRPLNFAHPQIHSGPTASEETVIEITKNKHLAGGVTELSEEPPETIATTIHVGQDGSETSSSLQSPVKKTKNKED